MPEGRKPGRHDVRKGGSKPWTESKDSRSSGEATNPRGGRSGNLAKESPKVPRCRKGASPEGTMRGGSGDTPVESKGSCIMRGREPQGETARQPGEESPKVPRCRKGASPEGTMCGRSVKNSGRIQRLQHHERSRTARGNGPATWRGSRRRCHDAGGREPGWRDARKERENSGRNRRLLHHERSRTARGNGPATWRGTAEGATMPEGASPDGTMCGGSVKNSCRIQRFHIRRGRNPQGGRPGNLARESPKVPRCRKSASQMAR